MNMVIILFASIFFLQQSPSSRPTSKEIPASLKNAFRERLRFDTARFQIRREDHRVSLGHIPLVSRHEYQWGGETLRFTDYGNDDGVRRVNPRTGEWPLGIAYLCLPEQILLNPTDNTLFTHYDSDAFVGLENAKEWPTYVDIRTVGLRAIEIQRSGPLEVLDSLGIGDFEFSETKKSNGIVYVNRIGEKKPDGTHYEFEWEIDVAKDFSVISVKEWFTKHGHRRLAITCNTDVKLIDGHWWPARVEYVSLHSGNRSVITFERVEFDRPEHPRQLTLKSMGIPIGAPVFAKGGRQRYVGTNALLSEADWKAVESQFDQEALKLWQKRMSSMSKGELPAWWNSTDETLGIEDVRPRVDAWEAYVRRWIMKRVNSRSWFVSDPLSESQKNAALGILSDCRTRAVAVQLRLTKERGELEAQIAAAEGDARAATSQSTSTTSGRATAIVAPNPRKQSDDNTARIAELKNRLDNLKKTQEIPALFDELKRRLENLLTEKQRTGPGQLRRSDPFSHGKRQN